MFWAVVERYKVTVMFSAPTAFRAIRREDPQARLMEERNLRSLRALFLAGERSEPGLITQYQRLLDRLAAPHAIVNDKWVLHFTGRSFDDNAALTMYVLPECSWWSTESGSPITACQLSTSFAPLRPRPGSAGLPLPGMDVRIVDDDGGEVERGKMGNIVLGQPLPPSALGTVWRNEKRFQECANALFP